MSTAASAPATVAPATVVHLQREQPARTLKALLNATRCPSPCASSSAPSHSMIRPRPLPPPAPPSAAAAAASRRRARGWGAGRAGRQLRLDRAGCDGGSRRTRGCLATIAQAIVQGYACRSGLGAAQSGVRMLHCRSGHRKAAGRQSTGGRAAEAAGRAGRCHSVNERLPLLSSIIPHSQSARKPPGRSFTRRCGLPPQRTWLRRGALASTCTVYQITSQRPRSGARHRGCSAAAAAAVPLPPPPRLCRRPASQAAAVAQQQRQQQRQCRRLR